MEVTDADLDLATLKGLASKARSAVNRGAWQRAMQARTTRVRIVLQALERAARRAQVRRQRRAGGWDICSGTTSVVVATVCTASNARSIAALREPLVVRIELPAALEMEGLVELERRGYATLICEEVPS